MERVTYFLLLMLVGPVGLAGPASSPAGADQFEIQLRSTEVRELTEWGIDYEHGRGVDKNLTFAIKLLCKAARHQHAPAQYELGWIYMNGRSGKRDLSLAAAWFQQAASLGDRHAGRVFELIGGGSYDRISPRCLLPDGSVYPRPTLYPEPKNNGPRPDIETIRAWVNELAPAYGLQPGLVLEIIRAESNFDAYARSSKNACGLMQLIPATAKRFGVVDIWDPIDNLRGGMAYLQWLQRYFKGNLRLTLAAYNAGEGAVVSYKGVPPYRETQRYISSIVGNIERQQQALLSSQIPLTGLP